MPPVLIAEIVSALVALIALLVLLVHLARTLANPKLRARKSPWHVKASLAMCAAAVVHGACALAYASGANALAYVFGWASLAAFLLSGVCMLAPVRRHLKSPLTWHIVLFVVGVLLVIAHAVAGRL